MGLPAHYYGKLVVSRNPVAISLLDQLQHIARSGISVASAPRPPYDLWVTLDLTTQTVRDTVAADKIFEELRPYTHPAVIRCDCEGRISFIVFSQSPERKPRGPATRGMVWTPRHERLAAADGWGLFVRSDTRTYEIEKIDDPSDSEAAFRLTIPRLSCDGAAIAAVIRGAAAGSSLCLLALWLDGRCAEPDKGSALAYVPVCLRQPCRINYKGRVKCKSK